MSKKLLLILPACALLVFLAVLKPDKQADLNTVASPEPSPELTNNYEELNWESYEFPEVGLSFSAPFEMTVTGERVDDTTFTLYIQRSSYPNPDYYQLYGLYNLSAKDVDLKELKSELEESTTIETEIAGHKALKGQYTGERNRLVTYIATDRGLFSLATSQPTKENGQLTDTILSTFKLN